MPNQTSNMDNFDSDEEKDKIEEISEHKNRIPCLDSDNIDSCSENTSNDAESHENPTFYYDTLDIGEKVGKQRRVGEGRAYKKPGRKLITSEPSTKRKAQNRAAQRAFRERREKYQKDLEMKVSNLQTISESINNENKVLHERMEKVSVELQECRSRLLLSESAGFNIFSSNNPFNVILNQGSQSYHHSPSEMNIDFDLSNFSCPQDEAVSMDEIKKEAAASRIKPIIHSHNTQKRDLDQSLVVKAPQKGLTETKSQPIETENSSLSNHHISKIPETGDFDDFTYSLCSSNRSNSRINIKDPNRLSSRAGFTNSNISHDHEISPNSSFASMNDHDDIFQSPLKLTVHPKFDNKSSESSLETIGERSLIICPPENPYEELHVNNGDISYTVQHDNFW